MRNIIKQKKGISEVVGYILLITISLSLSFLVYVWMKRQAFIALNAKSEIALAVKGCWLVPSVRSILVFC